MNNYIGIDISLNSTAISIQKDNNMVLLSFTNKKSNNIYIKELESCGVIFEFLNKEEKYIYSKNEIEKIKYFDKLSSLIVNKIKNQINEKFNTFCLIEGYSYMSNNTTSLLDIVALSTLIRLKLLKNINNINLSIISPSSLKKDACGYVYGFDNKGNTKNNNNISGGKFKKPEMYEAILDGKISCPIFKMLDNYKELINRKKIPNPIEDIIDSIFACKIKIKEIENDIR